MRYWGVVSPALGSSCNVLHSHLGLAGLVVSKNMTEYNNTTLQATTAVGGRYIRPPSLSSASDGDATGTR